MTVKPLPNAIDLSHHLNEVSKSRFASPLKDIMKYMMEPGMLSLAGGLPHPSLFPFASIDAVAYPPTADLSLDATPKSGLVKIDLEKYAPEPGQLDLNQLLQYGYASGLPALRSWLAEYVKQVYPPAYADWEILLNCGNTDGWTKVVRLLTEPNDLILTEEYTFPSAIAMWTSLGCRAVPVKMDGSGMRSDDLERVLSTWETERPNEKRPKLLYIVPVGSNPTGSTMPAARRQEIYDVCVKYDVIIAEDDPYSALQYPPFQITDDPAPVQPQSGEAFKQSLAPSFLEFDVQGRVIRMESFSKTLAPGSRLGFFVANPRFTERLLRATEVETQTPSGWSQGIVYELLRQWGTSGYLQWLSNLRGQYEERRNDLCAAIASVFTATPASQTATGIPGAEGVAIYPPATEKSAIKADELPLFSFVAPTGGMFLWSRHYLADAPRFQELEKDTSVTDPEKVFMTELWEALAKNKVLLTPGTYYVPYQGKGKETTKERGADQKVGYFRWAFSTATKEQTIEAVKRFEEVVRQFWQY
ncbi:hypothetical protein JCM8097_006994 [Rhodosporidiobolus ruineniae]